MIIGMGLFFQGTEMSIVKIFNDKNEYIGEYNIDNSDGITFSSGLDNEYVDIVKCYNLVGLELHIPSNLKNKTEIVASDNILGKVLYREYFSHNSSFYRKQKNLGNKI